MPFSQTPYHLYVALGALVLLLSALALYGLVCACVLRTDKRTLCRLALLSAVSLLLQQGMEDTFSANPQEISAALIGSLPAAVIVLSVLLIAAAEAALLWRLYIWRHEQLTPVSVKECLDALPEGVCFFVETGQPLLVNMQMSRICTQITGSGLMDASGFIRTLYSGNYPTCARLLRTEPTAAVEMPDGTVWEFRRSTHIVNDCTVEQLLALNVTEPYRLNLELTDRNRRLADVGARLRAYSRELQSVIRDDEILSAKIQVHNDVGRVLLMLRTYLAQKPHERDLGKLLARWSFVINVLSGEERSHHADTMEQILSDAESIGITVALNGTPPESGDDSALFLRAARECIGNIKRHAPDGKCLYVDIRRSDGGLAMEFTNDGQAPEEEITEGGGLRNLRQKAESIGWSMTVQSAPRFLLRLEKVKED